jgi:hypothetical protein
VFLKASLSSASDPPSGVPDSAPPQSPTAIARDENVPCPPLNPARPRRHDQHPWIFTPQLPQTTAAPCSAIPSAATPPCAPTQTMTAAPPPPPPPTPWPQQTRNYPDVRSASSLLPRRDLAFPTSARARTCRRITGCGGCCRWERTSKRRR